MKKIEMVNEVFSTLRARNIEQLKKQAMEKGKEYIARVYEQYNADKENAKAWQYLLYR